MEQSKNIKALMDCVKQEGGIKATVAILEKLIEKIKLKNQNGHFNIEDLLQDLLVEVKENRASLDASQKASVRARTMFEVSETAREMGFIGDSSICGSLIELTHTIKPIVGNDDNLNIIIEGKTGGMSLNEHLLMMKADPETAFLFADPSQKDKPKKEISNPWKKESFNLTQQGKIIKENPSLANRLKAEANA